MRDNRQCKGCSEEYRVTDEQISRVLSSHMFASDQCVTEDVYEKRLQVCQTCHKLQGHTTCSLCGCIVQISAKLTSKSCPYPGKDRWLAV